MAHVIYPPQFQSSAQKGLPVGRTDLTDVFASTSGDVSLSLRAASASLSRLETSGDEVCAHAETLEDLALQLDRQMQTLIDRTRSFTSALRGDLPRA